jgi:hypothetical protein
MQYILTQAEYDELLGRQQLDLTTRKEQLQILCTWAADHMPVSVAWKNNGEPEPWGCILTTKFDHCCDACPVQELCPHEYKEWSQ